jgi:hypothetical protein
MGRRVHHAVSRHAVDCRPPHGVIPASRRDNQSVASRAQRKELMDPKALRELNNPELRRLSKAIDSVIGNPSSAEQLEMAEVYRLECNVREEISKHKGNGARA